LRTRKALVGVWPALGALALAVFCAAPVLAGTEYVVTDLGPLVGPWSSANAVNDLGQVVGYGSVSGFEWSSSGGLINLNTPGIGSGAWSDPLAINDSGLIAGAILPAGGGAGGTYAAVWANGPTNAPTDIAPVSPTAAAKGAYSWASAENASGEVIGDYISSSGNAYAFSWTSTGGLARLNTAGTASQGWVLQYATGINAHGAIVGIGTYNGKSESFLDTGGAITDLGPAALLGWGAQAINNSGLIVGGVGQGANNSNLVQGAIWTTPNTNPTIVPPLSGGDPNPSIGSAGGTDGVTVDNTDGLVAVNSQGTIIGDSGWQYVPYQSDEPWGGRPTIIPVGGQMTDLNTLLVPADIALGDTVWGVSGISDTGLIAGYAYTPLAAPGTWEDAVLLTPTPEPISMIFFATGLVAVGGFVARRKMLRTA